MSLPNFTVIHPTVVKRFHSNPQDRPHGDAESDHQSRLRSSGQNLVLIHIVDIAIFQKIRSSKSLGFSGDSECLIYYSLSGGPTNTATVAKNTQVIIIFHL